MEYLKKRPRRKRQNESLRSLVREVSLQANDLVLPIFIQESPTRLIPSMPNIFCYSTEDAIRVCMQALEFGILAVALFPAVKSDYKNKNASYGTNPNNFYLQAIDQIKKNCKDLLVVTDLAMDPYNSDGHDGLVAENGEILNDETLEILSQMALLQASAGADILGASDMMDGRIAFLRTRLDAQGYENTLLMSYTVKYASNFYAPFRDALGSAPALGDKKSYQMDPANSKEAELEAQLDFEQGADILMVKPALAYLDIIQKLSQKFTLPIAVYNVSGEYAMVKAAAKNGWLDYHKTITELFFSFKRAGSDIIFSYHALEMAKILKQDN